MDLRKLRVKTQHKRKKYILVMPRDYPGSKNVIVGTYLGAINNLIKPKSFNQIQKCVNNVRYTIILHLLLNAGN